MSPRALSRLRMVLTIIAGLGIALSLTLQGLSGKITYFQTPSDIASGMLNEKQMAREIRVGGLVKTGTLRQSGEVYDFVITDNTADLKVSYRGILPDLFREGQGIVAHGHYDTQSGLFSARQILAKHDENYMPPDVKRGLEDAHKQGLNSLMDQ